MSQYNHLRINPPVLKVKKGAREVKIHVVSVMCDNKYVFTLKKNEEGDFKLSTHQFAYSNFGIPHDKYEIEWEADENNWNSVFTAINNGTIKIEKVVSR